VSTEHAAPGSLPPERVAADARTARAERVVQQIMAADAFSAWLGIEVVEADVGRAVLRLRVRDDMVNGFGIAHGGIVFSLADSAFACCTNAAGTLSVAVDCTISYPAAVNVGDVLTATAVEETGTRRLAFCAATVTRADGMVVGHFRGTVYRTSKTHTLPDD
jgi:acyl-CoA thioesterase